MEFGDTAGGGITVARLVGYVCGIGVMGVWCIRGMCNVCMVCIMCV